jgi:DNA (cytosine-5)-methyltransferase 1
MLLSSEVAFDNFAGGGGASLGYWLATGRHPEGAVNHCRAAIKIHTTNHPHTEHWIEDVWQVDPTEATRGRDVGFTWFSPDCTHFSKAKGGKPRSRKVRALAWVVPRWAAAVAPRVMIVENVEEFLTWGPLHRHLDDCPGDESGDGCLARCSYGQPIAGKAGTTFRRWFGRMRRLGYVGEWRVLHAHHYGAPTNRKRLFLVFRRDGLPIAWPAPTHGPGLLPYRTAADCVDWTLPCYSIFMTPAEVKAQGLKIRRPLAAPTMRRIAYGLVRHVLENPRPFVVPTTADGQPGAPILVQTGYGERKATAACKAQKPRVLDLHEPLGSVVACGQRHAVAVAYLVKHHGGHEGPGQSPAEPLHTVCTRNSKGVIAAELARGDLTPAQLEGARRVYAFLSVYNGTQQAPDLDAPMPTVLTKDRLALVTVTVDAETYIVVDVGMRMLTPRELARAQGFPDDYDIDAGGTLSLEDQVRMIGNAVCPLVAKALIEANLAGPAPHLKSRARRGTHLDLTLTTTEPERN